MVTGTPTSGHLRAANASALSEVFSFAITAGSPAYLYGGEVGLLLACWDADRIDWHSVTIEVDHGHEGASWSVANAKSWAATAAGYETALSKNEVLEEMPIVNERVVPIWIVQVFASSNEHAAEQALLTAS